MVSTDSSSPTEVGSTLSYDDYLKRRDTNTTVDEMDDRIAAEALCGLGHIGRSTRISAWDLADKTSRLAKSVTRW